MRLCIALCTLLFAVLANAGGLVKYRLPNGEVGFTDNPRRLPTGAVLESNDNAEASFDEELKQLGELASSGDVDVAKTLLNRKFVHRSNRQGQTALFAALANITLINDVLTLGADVRHRDNTGATALHYAARSGSRTAITTLLTWRADIDAGDENRKTPLMFAILADNPSHAQFLIEKGADIHRADNNGLTALYYAAEKAQTAVVKTLLERGANPNIASRDDTSPLKVASNLGERQIVELLIAKGAKH